tara:strand:+ start:608 stop:763 length:156 start_codon:yes stop_codon:yes gene_type:complete
MIDTNNPYFLLLLIPFLILFGMLLSNLSEMVYWAWADWKYNKGKRDNNESD